jgi:D-alanyl-D-alanine carboxypeptidase/D-alanyl-D-alanine-endopeptidase (penicillin-binding protein 4)
MLSGTRSSGRKVMIIVLSIVLVAAAATAAVLFWPKTKGPSTADSGVTSVIAPPTISAVDPPVTVAAARIKPLAVNSGKVPTPAGVSRILGPALANKALAQYTGEVIDAATGKVLWSKTPDTASQPASTLKLLTGAALLSKVNPASRFTTRIEQGTDGTIYFVGGGDVTLSAASANAQTVYTGASTVADLAAQVAASGFQVKRIVTDTNYWTGDQLADGWNPSDVAAGFVTPMQALMVDGDRKDPSAENSSRTGTPALTAGKALARALGNPNLSVTTDGTAPKGAKLLASVQSQPMSVLLAQALLNSDNILAEALARQVAITLGGAPSFTGAAQAVTIALQDLKFDTIGLTMADGSGISTVDRAPVSLLTEVMYAAVSGKIPALRGLITGLPVAGVSGTLSAAEKRFLSPQSKAGIGWVRAKTGSVQVTYAMVGYVPDVDGRMLVFGLNSNGVSNPGRNAQDVFAASLRRCGCS